MSYFVALASEPAHTGNGTWSVTTIVTVV